MKGLYLGKDFLSPEEESTDIAHWSMSYELFPAGSNWEGYFSVRVNNTWIRLHSDNRHQDMYLEQFGTKLITLKENILEFKEKFAQGKPKKPFNKRVWLNGETPGDYYFTGFVAYAIGGQRDFGAAISIADCTRTLIFRFEMITEAQKKTYGRIAENWEKQDVINMAILDKILALIDSFMEQRQQLIKDFDAAFLKSGFVQLKRVNE